MKEIEKEFDKLIRQIPRSQRHKKFVLITFNNVYYPFATYKNCNVLNAMTGEEDKIIIISQDDLDNLLQNEYITEIEVLN